MELWVGGTCKTLIVQVLKQDSMQQASGLYKFYKEGKGSLANNYGMALFTYVGNVFELCGRLLKK